MKKLIAICIALLLVTATAFAGDAPKTSAHHSKYILVQHDQAVQGKSIAYARYSELYRQAAATSGSEFYWLAAGNLTGDSGMHTYVTFADTLGELDTLMTKFKKVDARLAATSGENVFDEIGATSAGSSVLLAKFRDELSHNADAMHPAQVTRWRVTYVTLKPGTVDEYEALVKRRGELARGAGIDMPVYIYQVLAGMPNPTYVIVNPLKTLADLDVDYSQKYKTFPAEFDSKWKQMVRDIVVKSRTDLLVVNPKFSHVPANYMAENPGFWTVKDTTTAVATKGKKNKKGPVENVGLTETTKK